MKNITITDVFSGNVDRFKKAKEVEITRETGFPSPARDHFERPLSLDEHLIRHPAATFFVRVEGNNMNAAGVYDGDILIVDRSITPRPGHLVVALLEGEYTVKLLEKRGQTFYLCSEPSSSHVIPLDDEIDQEIWGVISYTIHKNI